MVKKWCWRVPTYPLLLVSDDLVTRSSGEVGNSPVHLKIESGFVKVSDDTSNVSALSFEVPPITEAIKTNFINDEASNIETLCEGEHDLIIAGSKPVINDETLLSSNKLNSFGDRVSDRSKLKN